MLLELCSAASDWVRAPSASWAIMRAISSLTTADRRPASLRTPVASPSWRLELAMPPMSCRKLRSIALTASPSWPISSWLVMVSSCRKSPSATRWAAPSIAATGRVMLRAWRKAAIMTANEGSGG